MAAMTPKQREWAEKWVEDILKAPEQQEKEVPKHKKNLDKLLGKVKTSVKTANKKEKIVILVAIVIIIVMTLFPPWIYNYKHKTTYSEKPTGYQFVFWPPSPKEDIEYGYGLYLDYKRLFLQWFMVVISTFGALLWLKIKNEQTNKPEVLLTKEEQKRITTGYLKNLVELGFQIKITPPKEVRRKNQLKKT